MFARVPDNPPRTTLCLGRDAAPAAGVAHLRFGDAEEQASALQGWNQVYLQLSAGAFRGELHQVQGSGIRLFIEQVQRSVLQTGVLDKDVLAVGIPLHASGPGMFCGTPCASDVLHVFSGASGFEFRPSRQHTMLGIELQLGCAALHGVGGDDARKQGLALPPQPGALRLLPAALAALRTYLLDLLRSAQARPELLVNPAVVATVADFLIDHMAQRGPALETRGSGVGPWRMVQQACALAQERLEYPPTVAQLCLDLGVSRRTLQNGFHRLLDVSPLAYLKAVRLHQARQALKHAGSVTEAATTCGFWHFGHFSQDYLALFGERPSQTLRRYHGT